MGRIFFFLLLALAIYLAWRWMQRASLPPGRARAPELEAQAMVSCAKCGLHVPRIEALPVGERYYCCEDHRRNGIES
jgi:uncharacterized protein